MKFFKKLSANILILAVFTIISLSLAEGLVRVFDLSCFSFKNPFTRNLGIWRSDQVSGHDFVENYPQTTFAFKDSKYPIWTNDLGCFDRPYRGEKDYILVVGDSITWGYVPFENVWGYSLEEATGKRVLKCGMPGYGTKEELIKIRKVVSKTGKSPELIVVGYFINDIDSDYVFPGLTVVDGYRVDKIMIANHKTGEKAVRSDNDIRKRLDNYLKYGSSQKPETLKDQLQIWFINNSVLYNMISANTSLRKVAYSLGLVKKQAEQRYHYISKSLYFKDPEKTPWVNNAWKQHLGNLKDMNTAAQMMGSKLLVVMIPPKEQVYKFLNSAFDFAGYDRANKRVSDFLSSENISFIDLTQKFIKYSNSTPREKLDSEKDLYWRCDPHMNKKGNHLTALLTAKYIMSEGLVDLNDVEERLERVEEKLNMF